MDIILILLISAMAFFSVQFVFKKRKSAPPILYLALRVLLWEGILIYLVFIGNNELLPSISLYNTVVMLLMFFAAGFSINIYSIKKIQEN